jgi:tRNA pseudouridine65 synthase
MALEILFEDEYLLAIYKPPGILVHRTPMSEDKVFLLQQVRDQVGYPIYTIHRLDRGTSGVLLFAKSPEFGTKMSQLFMNQDVSKRYLAIVRGWVADKDTIDYPLKDLETGVIKPQPAVTHYTCLKRSEINEAIGLRYPTARFSLVEVTPQHGRRHQIRKHFAHISHPIIGDKRHGDVKHNTYFREKHELSRMLLHASELHFTHPISRQRISLRAELDAGFIRALELMELSIDH